MCCAALVLLDVVGSGCGALPCGVRALWRLLPETCWEIVKNKHLTVASCWFSLSPHNLLTMHGHRNLKLCNIIALHWPWEQRSICRTQLSPLQLKPVSEFCFKMQLSFLSSVRRNSQCYFLVPRWRNNETLTILEYKRLSLDTIITKLAYTDDWLLRSYFAALRQYIVVNRPTRIQIYAHSYICLFTDWQCNQTHRTVKLSALLRGDCTL